MALLMETNTSVYCIHSTDTMEQTEKTGDIYISVRTENSSCRGIFLTTKENKITSYLNELCPKIFT